MTLGSNFAYLHLKFEHNGICAWEAIDKKLNLFVTLMEIGKDDYSCSVYHGGEDIDNMISSGNAKDPESAFDDAGLAYFVDVIQNVSHQLDVIRIDAAKRVKN